MKPTKIHWGWFITSWLCLSVAVGVSIWFYAYRVTTQKSLEVWALYCGQYRAKVWFQEERYRLLEVTHDGDTPAFIGRTEGPFAVWSWPVDSHSTPRDVQFYVDGFNTEMRRLWQRSKTQTNVPNQVLHQNRRPALPVRGRMTSRSLDSLPEFVASGGR